MKTYVFSVIINNIANYLPNEGFIGITLSVMRMW